MESILEGGLAGAVATGVDVLYATSTAVESVPGGQPIQNFNNGLNTIQNPNKRNNPNNQCDQKK